VKQSVLTIVLLMSTFLIVPASVSYVSEVDYIETTSEFFDQGHVVIEFVIDGADEKIHADLESSQLSDLSDQNTNQSVEISAKVSDVYAEYEVEDRGLRPLKPIEYTRTTHSTKEKAQIWADNNCLDLDNSGAPNYNTYRRGLVNPWGDWIVNCAIPNMSQSTFNVGFLQSPPDTLFESEWIIAVEGESAETVRLSNSGAEHGSLERVNDNVQLEFVSLKDTGSNAPNPQNTLAAFSSTDGWRLIEKEEFDSYITYIENESPKKVEEMREQDNFNIEDWTDKKNKEARDNFLSASREYEESPIQGSNVSDGKNKFQNGIFQYRPESEFEWFISEFNVRLNGDFVGLQRKFADLEIINIEDTKVNGLSSGSVEVEVANNGNGTGAFEVSASCDKFDTVGVSSRTSLKSGESDTVFLNLDTDGSEEFYETCNLNIKDLETTSIVSSSFTASYTPEKECTPGRQSVRIENGQEAIYECAEDGISIFEVDACELDERAKPYGEGYECQKVESLREIEAPQDCEISILPSFLNNLFANDYTFTNPICATENRLNDFNNSIESAKNMFTMLFIITGGLIAAILSWKISKTFTKHYLSLLKQQK